MGGKCWCRAWCSGYSEVFLGEFHKLCSVGGSVIRGVVRLVEDSVTSTFEFARRAIFEPNIPACGSKTEEDTRSGVRGIQFGASYPGLFHSDVTVENSDVGEVWSVGGVGLEGSDVTRE